MILFEFQIPMSVNTYWGFSGHRRFLTKKAVEFKKSVAAVVEKNSIERLADRLAVGITLHFPDRRVRDLDNYVKSLLDAMTQANVWVDDSQIDELVVRRGNIVKGGKCTVTIKILHEDSTQH